MSNFLVLAVDVYRVVVGYVELLGEGRKEGRKAVKDRGEKKKKRQITNRENSINATAVAKSTNPRLRLRLRQRPQ